MPLPIEIQIATRSKDMTDTPLCHAMQQVKQAMLSLRGLLIQIRAPHVPIGLCRFDTPTQQRQSNPRIKLSVEKELRLSDGPRPSHYRLRQRTFIGIAG